LRLHQQKLQDFEVKNGAEPRKKQKQGICCLLLLLFIEIIQCFNARNALDKAISEGGDMEAETTPTLRQFYNFF